MWRWTFVAGVCNPLIADQFSTVCAKGRQSISKKFSRYANAKAPSQLPLSCDTNDTHGSRRTFDAYSISYGGLPSYLSFQSIFQLYLLFTLKTTLGQRLHPWTSLSRVSYLKPGSSRHNSTPGKRMSFGGLLTDKGSNALLYEWLVTPCCPPIHPGWIRRREQRRPTRCTSIDLKQHWIKLLDIEFSEFMHRHGGTQGKGRKTTNKAHHSPHSSTKWVYHNLFGIYEKWAHWVTFIDSDEFIVMNRMGEDDKELTRTTRMNPCLLPKLRLTWEALPAHDSNATVLMRSKVWANRKFEPVLHDSEIAIWGTSGKLNLSG
jgi:hypothetical protein